MIALLYHVQVRRLTFAKVEITLVPNWLGRLLKRRTRVGPARRATCRYTNAFWHTVEDVVEWWWSATDRRVGWHIEHYIEAAPMSVEQLLLEDKS